MKNNTLAIALASLLVGGVAVAAFQNNRQPQPYETATAETEASADAAGFDFFGDSGLEYAEVLAVAPVTQPTTLYATVIGTEPVRETVTTSTPRQVCNDVVVQERMPERDGLMGGTIAGAVIGGALGNQVGDGNGRKLATVAGAVAGGYAGRRIDQRHVGGQVVANTRTECHTVSDSAQSSRVVAYNVTYRNPDGTTGSMRTGEQPGEQIKLGEGEEVVGYDVTYRHDGVDRTVRMEEDPGNRLPILDGKVVLQTAALDEPADRG
ncbi:MAG TPA: glycine zipper 2TM domain-containing protein [Xanthomonadaceae bacterium]|nr:glycine zipper 2TM domain-containing protein [Xanthomonadaceae bacterium]